MVRRSWHSVEENLLDDGKCPRCGCAIAGRWSNPHSAMPVSALARARSLAERRFGAVNF
jgi:hypothetical protein